MGWLWIEYQKHEFLGHWLLAGAHQMELPSPLISWVNPFPSRFINRTACFPRQVSYFRKSRMSPWKKWSWMKSNSEARPSTVFLFYYTSIFTILQPLGSPSGCHEIKVNELPDWDWAWSDGTKAANWGSRKGYLCECFFLLPPYIPHLSMHLEKSRRLSVLWTIWNLSMISAEKVPGLFDFLSSPWSGFRQLSTACKKRWPKKQLTRNASVPKFEKLQSSFTTDLYQHESCLIKLAPEKLKRRQQLLDRE